jgi:hypothetical protein
MIESILDRLSSELAQQEVIDGDLRDSILRSPTGESDGDQEGMA